MTKETQNIEASANNTTIAPPSQNVETTRAEDMPKENPTPLVFQGMTLTPEQAQNALIVLQDYIARSVGSGQPSSSRSTPLPPPETKKGGSATQKIITIPEEEKEELAEHTPPPKTRKENVVHKSPVSRYRATPFDECIMASMMPSKVKAPSIRFDGMTDPDEHLAAYSSHMYMYELDDSIWCRVFPTTLSGLAQTWFTSLPPGAISSFEELAAAFKKQYVGNRRRQKSTHELLLIRQGKNEKIRDYMRRFESEARQVKNLDDIMSVFALLQGLTDGAFKRAMVRKTPDTLADARELAEGYIREEEYQLTFAPATIVEQSTDFFPHQSNDNQNSSNRPPAADDQQGRNKRKKMEFSDRPKAVGSKYDYYTPLTASRAEIFAATEGDARWQKPAHPTKGGDRSKFCKFHNSPGHNTDDCRHLKDAIEDLIQQGYFVNFKAQGAKKPVDGKRVPVHDRLGDVP